MANRLLELSPTSLFGDKAILVHLEGREEISQPFEFFLSIASPNAEIKPEDVIGKPLAVKIDRGDEDPRFVHGYISHLWAGDFSETEDKKSAPSRQYRVRLVPWISFMQYASRSFVYLPEKLEKSIHDVLDEIVSRVESYSHVKAWINSNSAKILKSRKVEHCVQYRETDFNFLTRTLEQYGVYYYFTHEEDKHTLVLSDMPNYPDCAERKVDYPVTSANQEGDAGVIEGWEHAYEFVPGKFEQKDYDFKKPSTDLKVNTSKHGRITLKDNSNYEKFEYPGTYIEKDDGEQEIVRRLEEEEVRFDRVDGRSSCRSFVAGHCFKLGKHHSCKSEEEKSYLITSIRHSASQPGEFSSVGSAPSYTNYFSCVPKESQYRPPRTTVRPNLSSVQTAIVVGPSGEKIYTDEYGRVKVQFYWDREGKKDDQTSCWIRVAQNWAGNNWGLMQIPHIGHEVVIAFIEGNPDRPLIVGRVYNEEQKVPMTLPDKKTRSVLRDHGENEMVWEGDDGKQFMHFHQKCGNEMLFDGTTGQESVEIRDKYGNEIVMDAVKGTIRIFSPTHQSEIVLGRSIEFWSLSDMKINFAGKEQKVIDGSKHENIGGISSKVIAGLKQETVLLVDTKVNVGLKLELMVGGSVKYSKARQYEKRPTAVENMKEVFWLSKSKKEEMEKATIVAKQKEEFINKLHEYAKEIKMYSDDVDVQGKKVKVKGKVTIEGLAAVIKSKFDAGNGALKVPSSGPPASPPPKSKVSQPTAQNNAKKGQRQNRAARRAHLQKQVPK